MFSREFECPSCGAPIQQKTPGAKSLVCSFCGQTSHIHADSVEAAGEKHFLIDYGSVLSIGQSGKFEGRDFLVLGRLRLDYEDGFWDEWYVQFLDDGSEGWIQEDDGSFVLFKKTGELSNPPSINSIAVGQTTNLNGATPEFFVTSKSRASVNGGEGELPFRVVPGEPADFVDGILNGQMISIELLPDEKVVFTGYPFELSALGL